MKKVFFIITIIFLLFNKAYSANPDKGEATTYNITMQKVELCQDSTCSTSYTVGNNSKTVNIASASAGADIGSYAPTTGLPMGQTYSHLRVTLSRSFTISGSVTTDNGVCYTDGDTSSATDNLHVGTTTASSVAETTIWLADADTYNAANGAGGGANIPIAYTSPTYASTMSLSGNSALMIYELAAPYTVGFKTPVIKVTFNVSEALGAFRTGGGVCTLWPEEPMVTISIL